MACIKDNPKGVSLLLDYIDEDFPFEEFIGCEFLEHLIRVDEVLEIHTGKLYNVMEGDDKTSMILDETLEAFKSNYSSGIRLLQKLLVVKGNPIKSSQLKMSETLKSIDYD